MAMGGPPLASVFAGLAYAAGASQIAQVAGVQLAEGGIVTASQGGTQATIGEGGRDEAVIPLDDDDAAGRLGSNYTINVYGGMLGDQSTAREFAVAVDEELLKLRQDNESQSDTGLI